jgi:hypothetical protein
VPGIAGVDQVDRDLGVLDPSGGAGVLVLHPNRPGALLEVARLVDDQHGVRLAEVLDQVGAEVVADAVLVPDRPGQQVLHPVRAGVAGVLGERPAVLARQVGQQPAHERPGSPARLHPRKPARDPAQQLVQSCLPAGRINPYAVAGGHRLSLGCPHNTGSSTLAALVRSPALPLTSQVTIYGWGGIGAHLHHRWCDEALARVVPRRGCLQGSAKPKGRSPCVNGFVNGTCTTAPE